MSTAIEKSQGVVKASALTRTRPVVSIFARLLDQLSSVRFGIALLILLAGACMIGMIIMQQSVEGFDRYFADLTPAQKLTYSTLGFFDIYHTWYFNALLLTLSLNIVLASIDRFPGAWTYISRKKLLATRAYLLNQKQHAALEVAGESRALVSERIRDSCSQIGMRARISEKGARSYVFAERGAWNRLGAYAVHVALLTIFFGFFMTAQFGQTGQMPLMPGTSASEMTSLSFRLNQVSEVATPLPFTVECTDIQQKLIRPEGSLQAMNTIDWLTRIRIKDETGAHDGLVHLNEPLDYRGYRFFQASFNPTGNARSITLRLTPEQGGTPVDVSLSRDGETTLPDGMHIEFQNFFADFTLAGGHADTASDDYSKPAAQLKVTAPSGAVKTVYAFAMDLPSGAPVAAPFGGYRYKLADFEKAPTAHILSVQHDPGRYPFYLGGILLGLTLGGAFFFSHQRIWVLVEEQSAGIHQVLLGGNTNRNKTGFEDRFKRLICMIGGQLEEGQE